MENGNRTYVIIVAAGTGSRFGGNLPKQFCPLAGRPVLFHTIDRFRSALPECRIVVVISPSMTDFWAELCETHSFESPRVVEGGATRWASVANALAVLPDDDGSAAVLVHDGARPLVGADIISRVVSSVGEASSVIPVISVTDSLRQVGSDGESAPVDRSLYRSVQTPQGFRLDRLKEAYRLPYSPSFTDDASVVAAAGHSDTLLVEGSPENIKITNPGDMALAGFYLNRR